MKHRLNKPVAALYALLAAGTVGGGALVYNNHSDAVRDSDAARNEISHLLPLARRITAAVPQAEYETVFPDAAINNAEDLLLSPQTDVKKNCTALLNLRQVHAIATHFYMDRGLTRPALPLIEHSSVLTGDTPTRQLCAARLNR